MYEQVLQMKKEAYGDGNSSVSSDRLISQKVSETCLTICNLANLHSVQLVRVNEAKEALSWLRRAEFLSQGDYRCLAVTYNNIATCYNRIQQPRTALKYLEMALEKERCLEDSNFQADTHLNMCAVFSQMGLHDLALHHAQNAICIVQSSLLMTFLPDTKSNRKKERKKDKNFDDRGEKQVSDEMKNELKKELKERISILCLAYHNLGVEQEFLKMYVEALESYKLATQFSLKYFGPENALYQNFKTVYDKVKAHRDQQISK